MYTPRLKTKYSEEILPSLMTEFGYTSKMQVPKLTKISVNQRLGKAVSDKKLVTTAIEEMTAITGQKAVATISKKDVSKKATGFDGRGNFTMGITEQIVFPEIDIDKVNNISGMDITFVTSAKTDEEAKSLLEKFSFPFAK